MKRLLRTILHIIYRSIKPNDKYITSRKYSLRDRWTVVKVWVLFLRSERRFGTRLLYQSYEPLGLPGQRPTTERLRIYQIEELFSNEYHENKESENRIQILDIGCNMGCISLALSQYPVQIIGFDNSPDMIRIANLLKKTNPSEYSNVQFIKSTFEEFVNENSRKFDLILALAVSFWIGGLPEEWVAKVSSLLNSGGYLLIESNNYAHVNIQKNWEELMKALNSSGFTIIREGAFEHDCKRMYTILQNTR